MLKKEMVWKHPRPIELLTPASGVTARPGLFSLQYQPLKHPSRILVRTVMQCWNRKRIYPFKVIPMPDTRLHTRRTLPAGFVFTLQPPTSQLVPDRKAQNRFSRQIAWGNPIISRQSTTYRHAPPHTKNS